MKTRTYSSELNFDIRFLIIILLPKVNLNLAKRFCGNKRMPMEFCIQSNSQILKLDKTNDL